MAWVHLFSMVAKPGPQINERYKPNHFEHWWWTWFRPLTEKLDLLVKGILFPWKVASFTWAHGLHHMICYRFYHHVGCFSHRKFFSTNELNLFPWLFIDMLNMYFQLRIICRYVLSFPFHFPCDVDSDNYLFPSSTVALFSITYFDLRVIIAIIISIVIRTVVIDILYLCWFIHVYLPRHNLANFAQRECYFITEIWLLKLVMQW